MMDGLSGEGDADVQGQLQAARVQASNASIQLLQLQCVLDAKDRELSILRGHMGSQADDDASLQRLQAENSELNRRLAMQTGTVQELSAKLASLGRNDSAAGSSPLAGADVRPSDQYAAPYPQPPSTLGTRTGGAQAALERRHSHMTVAAEREAAFPGSSTARGSSSAPLPAQVAAVAAVAAQAAASHPSTPQHVLQPVRIQGPGSDLAISTATASAAAHQPESDLSGLSMSQLLARCQLLTQQAEAVMRELAAVHAAMATARTARHERRQHRHRRHSHTIQPVDAAQPRSHTDRQATKPRSGTAGASRLQHAAAGASVAADVSARSAQQPQPQSQQQQQQQQQQPPRDVVMELNVQGVVMYVQRSTVMQFPHSLLAAQLSSDDVSMDGNGRRFMPYDPACFRALLQALQDQQIFGCSGSSSSSSFESSVSGGSGLAAPFDLQPAKRMYYDKLVRHLGPFDVAAAAIAAGAAQPQGVTAQPRQQPDATATAQGRNRGQSSSSSSSTTSTSSSPAQSPQRAMTGSVMVTNPMQAGLQGGSYPPGPVPGPGIKVPNLYRLLQDRAASGW